MYLPQVMGIMVRVQQYPRIFACLMAAIHLLLTMPTVMVSAVLSGMVLIR